jgi:acetyl esterase/lipase
MTRRRVLCGVALALGPLANRTGPAAQDILAAFGEAHRTPTTHTPIRIAYGPDEFQFGDLRLPAGPGPHAVAVVIHGGCWTSFVGLDFNDAMSDALTAAGIATWNIEYRRTQDPGGGYPNTLTDVGLAVDTVRDLAPSYNLNLDRVITVGHSAGGHLGVWVGARHLLPVGHPLRGPDPLPLHAAVALAGIMNLAAYLNINICGEFVDDFMGGAPADVPERYALVSPSELLPIGLDTTLVQGTRDAIVPPALAEDYRDAAKDAGDHHVKLKKIHAADHFDVITPTSPAWPKVLKAILKALD